MNRPLFSICIPSYNRARHLGELLDSIISQDFDSYEIVICEDVSREREAIAKIACHYAERLPGKVRYIENEQNLGYDRNIRRLVECADGRFCFFMGNDDVMCPGALVHVAELIRSNDGVGLVLKSYAWFDDVTTDINQTVRYFEHETAFKAGAESIAVCYRRSGVISGYIVDRDSAHACATDRFDGTLYYQMHLTASVLVNRRAIATPQVLVLCRSNEPPEFGNSESEKGKYVPGAYTPEARLNMIRGALDIIRNLRDNGGPDVVDAVERDYANYFYPYIKDQLRLPLRSYWAMYRSFGRMGFDKHPLFHVYFFLGYMLGERRFDALTRQMRKWLGRSPQFGNVAKQAG